MFLGHVCIALPSPPKGGLNVSSNLTVCMMQKIKTKSKKKNVKKHKKAKWLNMTFLYYIILKVCNCTVRKTLETQTIERGGHLKHSTSSQAKLRLPG